MGEPGVLELSVIPRVVDKARVASHAIDAQEAFVLAQIDGRTAVEDIIAVTGVSAFDISVILTPLIREGAVVIDEPRAGKASRSRATVSPRPRTLAPRATKHPPRGTLAPEASRRGGARKTVAPAKPSRPPTIAPASKRSRATVAPPRHGAEPPKRRATRKSITALSAPPAKATAGDGRRATRRSLGAIPAPKGTPSTPPAQTARRTAATIRLPRARASTALKAAPSPRRTERPAPRSERPRSTHPPKSERPQSTHPAPKPAAPRSARPPAKPATLRPRSVRPSPSTASRPPAPPVRVAPALPPVRVPPDAPMRPRVSAPAPVPACPPPRAVDPSAGAEVLMRFFSAKVGRTSRDRVKVFVDAAEAAVASGKFALAAQNYDLALQACDAPDVRAALEQVAERARTETHARDLKAASAAEKGEQWDVAAVRYGRAYAAVPSASVAERLAHVLRMQGTDLRRAVKMAEEAVLREPANVPYRVTLGLACADAGLWARAQGEAERALAAAPRDEGVLALVARTKGKGGAAP